MALRRIREGLLEALSAGVLRQTPVITQFSEGPSACDGAIGTGMRRRVPSRRCSSSATLTLWKQHRAQRLSLGRLGQEIWLLDRRASALPDAERTRVLTPYPCIHITRPEDATVVCPLRGREFRYFRYR